jgi:hypothetical protein
VELVSVITSASLYAAWGQLGKGDDIVAGLMDGLGNLCWRNEAAGFGWNHLALLVGDYPIY